MANLAQLRATAREIFDEGLRSVDAGAAIHRKISLRNSRLDISETTIDLGDRNVYSIAIGKAGLSMAGALEDVLGERLTGGIVATSFPQSRSIAVRRHRLFHGGHPEPNEESLAAAQAAFDLLKTANDERALIIFSISGGGSAMIEWPSREDITLANLRAANAVLVKSGASISEVNAVRRSFSAVKGGGLAWLAPHCEQHTLWISDVPLGEERNIASGPSLPAPEGGPDAVDVIAQYDLGLKLPPSILRAIESYGARAKPEMFLNAGVYLLLDNQDARNGCETAAQARGYLTWQTRYISDQPIEVGVRGLRKVLRDEVEKWSGAKVCVISGGEFSCPVRGDGIGGRNLETALRLALEFAEPATFDWVALCAGTDGIDGNSPATGAIVDSTTIRRAKEIGLDPEDYLRRSDSYSFFKLLGDEIVTGPTGTNVRDLRIVMAGPQPGT